MNLQCDVAYKNAEYKKYLEPKNKQSYHTWATSFLVG